MPDGMTHVLRAAHDTQNTIAVSLQMMATEHHADAEIAHVAADLLHWTRETIAQLAELAARQGIPLDRAADEPGLFQQMRASMASKAKGPVAALLLLENLRRLYLTASDASLALELLAQFAQAQRHTEMLELSTQRHPHTLRVMKWANTMIKTIAPQVLTNA